MRAAYLFGASICIAVLLLAVWLMDKHAASASVDGPLPSPNGELRAFHVLDTMGNQLGFLLPDPWLKDWNNYVPNGKLPFTRLSLYDDTYWPDSKIFRPWICNEMVEAISQDIAETEEACIAWSYQDSVLAYLHASLSLCGTPLIAGKKQW